MSTAEARLRPRCSWPERRQAALQLGDRAVDRGEVLGRAGRQRPVELGQRPRGRHLLGPLDQRPLELAAQVALERPGSARGRADAGRPPASRLPACRPSVRRIRCTSTPTTPEPSPWRPKAAIASRAASRISPSLPSAIACADRLAQLRRGRAGRRPRSGAPRGSPARAPRPRRRGRRSGRRAARRPGGPPATWRSSPRAPRGSRPARSTGRRRAPRTRRGARRCRPRRPRRAAPRRRRRSAGARPGGQRTGFRSRWQGRACPPRRAARRPARRPGRCRCGA